MNMFDLSGKKAVITGGVQGLGRAMAEGLSRAGCELAILDVNPDTPELARAAGVGAKASGIVCDLGDPVSVEEGFAQALTLMRGADILVNNAGINLRKNLAECTSEDWNHIFAINSTAPFLLTQLAARVMKARGYGKIINIASMLAFLGAVGNGSYAASKGSVLLQTRSFSNELAPYGICVNAIAPGYFKTELNSPERMKVLGEDFVRSIDMRIPAGRWGNPEDLQGTVVFLASRASDYVTGACIPVDGGYLAR